VGEEVDAGKAEPAEAVDDVRPIPLDEPVMMTVPGCEDMTVARRVERPMSAPRGHGEHVRRGHMRMWRLVLVVVLVAAVDTGVTLRPAQADGSCVANRVCVWKDVNFAGCRATLGPGDSWKEANIRWDDCGGGPYHEVSSYRNNYSNLWIWFATKAKGEGERFCVAPGASGSVAPQFNDKLASHYSYNPPYDPHCQYTDTD
jgi:hypothetical protein